MVLIILTILYKKLLTVGSFALPSSLLALLLELPPRAEACILWSIPEKNAQFVSHGKVALLEHVIKSTFITTFLFHCISNYHSNHKVINDYQ